VANLYLRLVLTEKFAEETFKLKHRIEQLLELEDKPKPEEKKPAKSPSDLVFMDDPVHYIREKLDLFFTIARNDPIQAIKFVPEAAGGIAAVAITLIAVIIGLVSMGGSTPPPQVKKAAENVKTKAADAKDKVTGAAASGAEAVKGQAEKRSTRST
jgi:calnexin